MVKSSKVNSKAAYFHFDELSACFCSSHLNEMEILRACFVERLT